jgi:CheY-like chemotaxis protein
VRDAPILLVEDDEAQRVLLARFLEARGFHVVAVASAAELSPRDPRAWFYLAVVQGDHLGKPQDALAALRRYKELGGKDSAALTWLAQLEGER